MLGTTAEETTKLIKKDPNRFRATHHLRSDSRPQVSALLTTAGLVTGCDPKEIAEEIGNSGAGALDDRVREAPGTTP